MIELRLCDWYMKNGEYQGIWSMVAEKGEWINKCKLIEDGSNSNITRFQC